MRELRRKIYGKLAGKATTPYETMLLEHLYTGSIKDQHRDIYIDGILVARIKIKATDVTIFANAELLEEEVKEKKKWLYQGLDEQGDEG